MRLADHRGLLSQLTSYSLDENGNNICVNNFYFVKACNSSSFDCISLNNALASFSSLTMWLREFLTAYTSMSSRGKSSLSTSESLVPTLFYKYYSCQLDLD